ncbi:hypothetical protein Dsin_031146 [Dipteronia sinensis]|uniref:NAC domain-containing protein n=1 Tax=Dipteronia sinensis TaxID=43782 RepID=A0AAE0DT40_9ROSI|nr:hypothetical protein Dsin_031146 [Dipteronia sinensis]
MEKANSFVVNGGVRLPIGYRFRPTDEELVVHYLKRKAFGLPLPASVIPDFDVFQVDPWSLPGDLKEKRYFFGKRVGNVVSDNKNCKRGAGSGYWKYIGKDRQIVGSVGSREVVGVRKTMVFCQVKRAREITKTRWVMHEYRLINSTNLMSRMELGAEWAVYRIFQRKKKPRKHGGAVVVSNQTNGMINSQSCIVFSIENSDNFGTPPPQPSSSCSSEVTDEISSNVLDQEETSTAYNNLSFNSSIRKY